MIRYRIIERRGVVDKRHSNDKSLASAKHERFSPRQDQGAYDRNGSIDTLLHASSSTIVVRGYPFLHPYKSVVNPVLV